MKQLPYIIAVISVLLLAGCQQAQTAELPSFIGGKDGVVASFVDNSPPKESYDGGDSPFDVEVKLENKGETPVTKEQARVKITGIRAQEFNLLDENLVKAPEEALPELTKQDGKIQTGSPVFVSFPNFNHVSYITGASLPFPIRADVCYGYASIAVSKLCIRENVLNPPAGGLCEINADKPVASSGAPIQVENVKESARASNKIQFSFDVVHVGTGNIFKLDSRCDKTSRVPEDKVFVTVDTKLPGLTCSGLNAVREGAAEGEMKIIGNSRTVSCQQTVTNRGDYELPVNFRISYDYETTIQTTVAIKHAGELNST